MTEHTGDANPHKTAKADAKAAQAYAKATRPWYKKKRWWLAGFVLILIMGSALGGGGEEGDDTTATDNSSEPTDTETKKKKASSQEEPEEEPEEEPAAQTVKIAAVALLKEFEGNEAAADLKFKGKVLEVTGKVSKVDTELMDEDEYVVMVNGGGDFEFLTVDCDDQSSDDVVKLTQGQAITVVGDFEDGGDLGVDLDNCTIK